MTPIRLLERSFRPSVAALIGLMVAFCTIGCGDTAGGTSSDVDSGNGPDTGDVGNDSDDADLGGGDIIDSGLVLRAAATELSVDELTSLTATAWLAGAPLPDRSAILFEVTNGTGFFEARGLDRLQMSSQGGEAVVRFLPSDPGLVTITATFRSGDVTLTDRVDLTVTGQLADPQLIVDADVDDGIWIDGRGPLAVSATVISPQGRPAEDVSLAVSTSNGLLTSAAGVSSTSINAVTDAEGLATFTYEPSGFRGFTSVNVVLSSGVFGVQLTETLTFDVVSAADLTLTALQHERLGVSGSGYQQSASYTLQLLDRRAEPIEGAELAVRLVTLTDATVAEDTLTTDEDGLASGQILAGVRAGPFRLAAETEVDEALVGFESERYFVVTTRPVSRFSQLSCTPLNLGGLSGEELSSAPVTAACTGQLTDRLQQPVPIALTVNLDAEIGTLPAQVDSDDSGAFSFDWVIDEPPVDLPPFREGADIEPLFDPTEEGESNPRDRMARVIFWVEGEEYFTDDSEDGLRQAGEGFWERGEPYVDIDDNGWRDDGEPFVDAPWGVAATYDAANAQWDAATLVWGAALVSLSGAPTAASTGEGSDRAAYSGWLDGGTFLESGAELLLRENTTRSFDLLLADDHGAVPNPSTLVNLALDGCGDDVVLSSDDVLPVADRLGLLPVSVQVVSGVGWELFDTVRGFEPGLRLNVRLNNPARGDSPQCTLRALVEYGRCATCERTDSIELTLDLDVE